jgi:hypothetical protein
MRDYVVDLTILVQQCACMVKVYWKWLVHVVHMRDVIYRRFVRTICAKYFVEAMWE